VNVFLALSQTDCHSAKEAILMLQKFFVPPLNTSPHGASDTIAEDSVDDILVGAILLFTIHHDTSWTATASFGSAVIIAVISSSLAVSVQT
jgi:hypothetical protein